MARVLFVGDIHLGRAPSHIPASFDPTALGPRAAWRAVASHAIEARLDAVVLAGDVVEGDNAAIEAYGYLEAEVRRMTEAGIPVYAVAGNHDVVALPRLADALPGRFHLLGRGGAWERVTLTADGAPVAHLVGWSFGARKVQTSPLAAGFPGATGDGLPTFGVLHCDLDVAHSDYAPVSRAELDAAGLQGWFLGHIHKPDALTTPHPLGYCGSLVGLDPSETGLHAPWLLTLERGAVRVEQVPLSPLRWESETVTVPRDAEPDLLVLVRDAVDRIHARVHPQAGETQAVGCRIRLTGATAFHAELRRACDTRDAESSVLQREGIQYFVDRVENATRPAVDLAALSVSRDPAGALAARLLALEGRTPAAEPLLRRARDEMRRVAAGKSWLALDNPDLSDDAVRQILLDAGYVALDALLAQVPAAEGSR